MSVVVGVLVVKVALNRPSGGDIADIVYLTVTDVSGHVTTRGVHNALTSAYMEGVSRSIASASSASVASASRATASLTAAASSTAL